MSAHAIFVNFIPKTTKLARTVPRLWGRLRPLEHEPSIAPERSISRESVSATRPSYNLRLVADSETKLSKPSAIYIDLDDYQ